MIIQDWLKKYKNTIIGIVIIIFVIGFLASIMLVSLSGSRSRSREAAEFAYQRSLLDYPDSLTLGSSLGLGFPSDSVMPSESTKELEVKEGSIKIESKEAENDFTEIKSMVENYRGYVERSNKSVTNLYIQLDLILRVPSENFAGLVERLKEEFKVEHYSIKNYRIPIGRELDELEILNKSLSDYENIREEINEMRAGKDKIDLLMQLTDKQLGLKERERKYQSLLSSKERQGEYATLNVSLRQRQSPTIWPENVLDQFKDRLRRASDNSFAILRDLIGGSIEIFFRAVQIAVYIFIVGIVLAVFYRLTRRLFGWIVGKNNR